MKIALAFLFASPLLLAAPQQDDLKAKAKGMKPQVTKIRGVEFKSEVGVGVYTKAELHKFILGEFDRELPPAKAKKYEKAYKHMGLVPNTPEWNLRDSYLVLFRDAIAGFYHPKTKELRLIDEGGGGPEAELMMNITLVHELHHAAQDQNFDLVTVPMEEEYNDDMVAGVKCLIEGDASIVGWKYGLGGRFDATIGMINSGYKSGELPGEAGKLPAYLRLTLTFSYGYGCEFVLACLKGYGGDWKKIDKMFEDLPSSTEQVLHPEKYWKERDYPQIVTLPALPKDWTPLLHNVHGEYPIRILLRELKAGAKKDIEKAAEGWDGDRYYVYERGDQVSTVWYSTWDSEEDAKEFFDAYKKALQYKYKDQRAGESTDTRFSFSLENSRGGWMERKGCDVLVIDGDADIQKHAGKIWSEAKKVELTKVERFTAGCWTCEKHPEVEKDTNSYCWVCGEKLTKQKAKKDEKKEEKKDYR